jgi:hypothetical protein
MRKTTVLAVLVLALAAADIGALDIAIGAGLHYQLAMVTDFTGILPEQESSIGIDLRAWPFPLQLGLGFSQVVMGPTEAPLQAYGNFTLTADWWLVDVQLGNLPLRAHLGAGAWTSLPVVGFGARASAGLRWTPIPSDRGFEAWLELVPMVGMYVVPSALFRAGGGAGLGLRYWFGR